MLNPSFKELSEKGDSRYTLSMLVAKRARKMVDGSKPLVETESKKAVTIALEELLAGEITYKRPPSKETK